jgi:hypothetical protein
VTHHVVAVSWLLWRVETVRSAPHPHIGEGSVTDRLRFDGDDFSVDLLITPHAPRPARRPLLFILGRVEDRRTHTSVRTIDVSGRDLMTQLLDSQRVLVTIAEKDAFGDPVPDDKRGQLTASSSDETLATVTPGDNPGEFWVTGVDGADAASVAISFGDNISGDEAPEFFGSASFDLFDHRHGVPAELVVTVGEPEVKPAP